MKESEPRKIKVGVIYKKDNPFLTGKYYDNIYYHFFISALQRNSKIEVKYFPTDDIFDASILKNKVDIILLFANHVHGMPNKITNIKKLNIPVIARAGDPEDVKSAIPLHENWKIDHYFHHYPKSLFHELYPNKFPYEEIMIGIESRLYENIKSFDKRIKDKILNSGNAGNNKPISKLICYLRDRSTKNPYIGYKLRTLCNKLPYVDYTPTLSHEYNNDRFTLLLQKYTAAIAATSDTPTIKYFEIPASGCLTFMEITQQNKGDYLGYIDGETAIFINEKNYKQKFDEYLSDPYNPKWEKIATAGREYTLKNFTNDKAIESLVNLMKKLLN